LAVGAGAAVSGARLVATFGEIASLRSLKLKAAVPDVVDDRAVARDQAAAPIGIELQGRGAANVRSEAEVGAEWAGALQVLEEPPELEPAELRDTLRYAVEEDQDFADLLRASHSGIRATVESLLRDDSSRR
jgi:hypothetical protein